MQFAAGWMGGGNRRRFETMATVSATPMGVLAAIDGGLVCLWTAVAIRGCRRAESAHRRAARRGRNGVADCLPLRSTDAPRVWGDSCSRTCRGCPCTWRGSGRHRRLADRGNHPKSADAFFGRESLFRELGFMPGRAANAEAGYRAARPRPLNNTPLLSGSLWRSVHRPRRATPPRSAWSNIFRTTAGCWCCTDLMGAGRREGRWLRLSKTPARQPGLWPSAAAAWAWTRGDLAPCRSRTGRQGTLDRDAGIQEASEMATPSISWT